MEWVRLTIFDSTERSSSRSLYCKYLLLNPVKSVDLSNLGRRWVVYEKRDKKFCYYQRFKVFLLKRWKMIVLYVTSTWS